MTIHDFLEICTEVDVLPAVALETEGVRDLLKRDKDRPRMENQLLLGQLLNAHVDGQDETYLNSPIVNP